MRRRRKKGSDKKLLSFTDYVIKDDIENLKGKWSSKFENNNPIHVEFGTGRGKFITTHAKNNPEVLLKAVEKAHEANLNNILFVWGNVNNILDYFEEKEISRVYVNFCDPWPKKRWAKRRLTHSSFLEKYDTILKDDGELHFKTDNRDLFEFSLNEIAASDWMLKNISLDLAKNTEIENITTEYEDKFMSQGMQIYRCEAKKRK